MLQYPLKEAAQGLAHKGLILMCQALLQREVGFFFLLFFLLLWLLQEFLFELFHPICSLWCYYHGMALPQNPLQGILLHLHWDHTAEVVLDILHMLHTQQPKEKVCGEREVAMPLDTLV